MRVARVRARMRVVQVRAVHVRARGANACVRGAKVCAHCTRGADACVCVWCAWCIRVPVRGANACAIARVCDRMRLQSRVHVLVSVRSCVRALVLRCACNCVCVMTVWRVCLCGRKTQAKVRRVQVLGSGRKTRTRESAAQCSAVWWWACGRACVCAFGCSDFGRSAFGCGAF